MAHKAAYKARSAVTLDKDPTLRKKAPHTRIKEAPPAKTPIIYFSAVLDGIIEFKANCSDEVLGRVELDKDHITGEVIAPNVKAEEKCARIAAGVDGAEQRQVNALAKRLKGI